MHESLLMEIDENLMNQSVNVWICSTWYIYHMYAYAGMRVLPSIRFWVSGYLKSEQSQIFEMFIKVLRISGCSDVARDTEQTPRLSCSGGLKSCSGDGIRSVPKPNRCWDLLKFAPGPNQRSSNCRRNTFSRHSNLVGSMIATVQLATQASYPARLGNA